MIINETLSANGNSAVVRSTGGWITVLASGTFGSGTITGQVSLDGTNYVSAGPDAVITASGSFRVSALPGVFFRINLSGATSPSILVQADA